MMSAEFTTKLQDLDERRLQRNWSDIGRSWPSPKRNNLREVHSPMPSKPFIQRCRNWYAKLLRLYPKPHRERFGEPMEQTFNDLCRERVKAERGLFSFALWMFFETSAAIIRENLRFIIMQKNIVRIAIGSGLILLIPLVLTLLGKWQWDKPRGYVLAFVLLFASGLAYELVAKKMDNKAYRFGVGVAVVTALLVVCINFVQAADDVNPAAMMYFWVPLFGIIGAAVARFQPRGMTRALFATALAQALVLAIVLIVRNPQVTSWTPAVLRGFGLNAFFVMLFAGSALLFRRASPSHLPEQNRH